GGSRASARCRARAQVQGGAERGLWRGTTRRRSRRPQGLRYRQQAHADPSGAGQGSQGPQRHAVSTPARSAACVVEGSATTRLAVSRPRPSEADDHAPTQSRLPRRGAAGRDQQARIAPHITAQLRHPSARAEHRHSRDPGAARSCQAREHGALHAGCHQDDQSGRQPVGAHSLKQAEPPSKSAARVSRPALEVADIFRDHGPAWRQANAGHVSLGQLKVMSAIESCRTAALGGHVARCEDCAYTTIAYNSCRNRHCPKCQGAAAKAWLAEREAELLPVPYYHVVFTLPAAISDIAYQNKAFIYDLLFKVSAETLITIAADPKHLGARVGVTSVLHTWGSALTHHPHVHMIVPGGGISLD